MQLLLRKDIPKLGLCGDIVEVSEGYARNYLLPCRLALAPTKANLKAIEEDKKRAAEERARRHAFLKSMSERLAGVSVTISAACTREGHLYGSVGPREISRALMDEGHSVHPDQIKMSQNIKEIGAVDVPVVLSEEISATVKVYVTPEKGALDLDEEEAPQEAGHDPGKSADEQPEPAVAEAADAGSPDD